MTDTLIWRKLKWISVFYRKYFCVYSRTHSRRCRRHLCGRRSLYLFQFHRIAPYAIPYTLMGPLSGLQRQPLFHPITHISTQRKKTSYQLRLVHEWKKLKFFLFILTLVICATPGAPQLANFCLISAKSTFLVAAKSSKNLL